MLPENKESLKSILKIAVPIIGFILLVYIVALIAEKHDPESKIAKVDSINKHSDTVTGPIDTNEVIQRYSALVDSLELSLGTDRVNIQKAMTVMAGVTGKVKWEYDISPKNYKDNPDIFIADGESVNTDNPAKKQTMFISLLVNSRTGVFKVLSARRNGEKLKGAVLITTLAVEGGYSTSTTY